ncbi:hypothetical protein BDR26DRAFT_508558 [Obelidium mucronatum]|nr:hypothetical protein BDR26DRAFT_508558 [Obelidium mucronatum]
MNTCYDSLCDRYETNPPNTAEYSFYFSFCCGLNGGWFVGKFPAYCNSCRLAKNKRSCANRRRDSAPTSNLILLNLSKKELSGPIPETIGQFAALKSLDLSGNKFTGAIPDSLKQLQNLEVLNIAENQLIGELPKSLVQLMTSKGGKITFGLNCLERASNQRKSCPQSSKFINCQHISDTKTFMDSKYNLAWELYNSGSEYDTIKASFEGQSGNPAQAEVLYQAFNDYTNHVLWCSKNAPWFGYYWKSGGS